MKALLCERSVSRFAAARLASSALPGAGGRVGPLRMADVDEPALPGPGWHLVRPRLAGICGSDLATVDGRSSRWFEPFVSFPFAPGHEVVADLDGGGGRAVIEPVLKCEARGIRPPCDMCAEDRSNLCERTAFGQLKPGLQTGYCADTGGGWSQSLVAHDAQLHRVPEAMSDEAAVLVEPAACAVHAARSIAADEIAVVGAGTLGLLTIAAIRRHVTPSGRLVAAAKYPHQRRLAAELGADVVCEPAQLERAVRRATRSLEAGAQLTAGVDCVVDCVGTEASLAQALRVAAPGGTIVLLGMPAPASLDLTPLWQREVQLRGAYAYQGEDFAHAFDLVAGAGLERLVSALYPLDRYSQAIEHAANAGSRGAVKVAFDLRHHRSR